ncbi:MAG: hypothetical protein KatS3mg098_052 [Candidatus Parcubacteria bacterium]|nr:DUF5667 domain-containing protein [Patescibacteria group bacterium]BCX15823.1 MAG: hypothetical protein KatS3mg098_052 [Candidatus Parcubacteria bacterium]
MNKIKLFAISLFALPLLVFAQNQTNLPSAGLTPESPFYFLDRLGEALQRFFTFNPESQARLEISFAKERIAEIKLVLEKKGVNAKGLSVAEARLADNLKKAAVVLVEEKQSGKDTANLAKELSQEVEEVQNTLKETFQTQKEALKAKESELKAKIKEARQEGDTAQVEALVKQLAEVKTQRELLDQKEEESDSVVEEEREQIEEAMGLQEEIAKKIREVEKDKAEIINEAKNENVEIPAGAFNTFDSLLSQVKSAFTSGNYDEAKRLVKEAKKSLKEVEKNLEKLSEAEDDEDKKAEAEEQKEEEKKIKEVEEEKSKEVNKNKEEGDKNREEVNQQEGRLEEEEKDEKQSSVEQSVVTYTNSGYSPSILKIKAGTTVIFKNESSRSMWTASAFHPSHTVYGGTSLEEHCPDTAAVAFDACSGVLPGNSWSFTFTKKGSWKYHNHLAPSDFGTIVVE